MKRLRPTVIRFVKNWSELVTIPIAVMLWLVSAPLLRLMDPTSAVFDAGILQKPLLATIFVLFFGAVVRIIMKLQWPIVDKHLDGYTEDGIAPDGKTVTSVQGFESDFLTYRNLTAYQRVCVSCFVYFLYLLSLALIMLAL